MRFLQVFFHLTKHLFLQIFIVQMSSQLLTPVLLKLSQAAANQALDQLLKDVIYFCQKHLHRHISGLSLPFKQLFLFSFSSKVTAQSLDHTPPAGCYLWQFFFKRLITRGTALLKPWRAITSAGSTKLGRPLVWCSIRQLHICKSPEHGKAREPEWCRL